MHQTCNTLKNEMSFLRNTKSLYCIITGLKSTHIQCFTPPCGFTLETKQKIRLTLMKGSQENNEKHI